MLVALPQPYDFEVSTARFEVYGRDRATLWREGGIHRVFAGREVRIEAAPGGVDVEPHDPAIEREVLRFLGLPFDLDGFSAWARGDGTLGPVVAALPGYRPPLQPDPFEALVTSITAQQVSLQSAAAIRSRFIERYGVAFEHALTIIDLRLVCNDPRDYANPIEPSSRGGAKIARAIWRAIELPAPSEGVARVLK